MMAATDRSISPAMIRQRHGKAIIAFLGEVEGRVREVPGDRGNRATPAELKMKIRTATPKSSTSQLDMMRRSGVPRRSGMTRFRSGRKRCSCGHLGWSVCGCLVAQDDAAAAALASDVEDDGDNDDGAGYRHLPEGRYVDDRQRVLDDAEEERAEHRADDRADAAGNRDAADDAGRDTSSSKPPAIST